LLYVISKRYLFLLLGIILLGFVVLYRKEGYTNINLEGPTYSNINKYLSDINPLGNTLMNEYKYDPNKEDSVSKTMLEANSSYGKTASYETNYNNDTEKKINDKTKEFIYKNNENNSNIKDLFEDSVDNMEFEHQMRQFHTTPNTTIPNDQSSFLNYCYGILPSDKSVISH